MIVLRNSKILLRDFQPSDIEKRLYWETRETEWQLWDGPWEYEGKTPAELASALADYRITMAAWVEKFRNYPVNAPRTCFQIDTCTETPRYIGWCSSYGIDENGNYGAGSLCTVGIDLPDPESRSMGYGASALSLFIHYLLQEGKDDIYTQTWSGNVRMIGLAKKLGFTELLRKKDQRLVRGRQYDGLTFRLNLARFREIFPLFQ